MQWADGAEKEGTNSTKKRKLKLVMKNIRDCHYTLPPKPQLSQRKPRKPGMHNS